MTRWQKGWSHKTGSTVSTWPVVARQLPQIVLVAVSKAVGFVLSGRATGPLAISFFQ